MEAIEAPLDAPPMEDPPKLANGLEPPEPPANGLEPLPMSLEDIAAPMPLLPPEGAAPMLPPEAPPAKGLLLALPPASLLAAPALVAAEKMLGCPG